VGGGGGEGAMGGGGDGGLTDRVRPLATGPHVSTPFSTPKPRARTPKATSQADSAERDGKIIDELEKQYVQAPLEAKSITDSPGMVPSTKVAQVARELTVGAM
jgi:hypothetical protein